MSATVPIGVRIRRAASADAAELARLRWAMTAEEGRAAEALHDFTRRFVPFAEAAIDGDRWVVVVAETDGGLVGDAWLALVDRVPRPAREAVRIGYLTNVYVLPERRDQGVGSAILDAVRGIARDADCEVVIVWPSERSVPLYRRAGFAPPVELLELHLRGDA